MCKNLIKKFLHSEQYDKEKSIKLNLEDIICDEELANIKCKTYFLKQTKHEIDIKEPKQNFHIRIKMILFLH